MLPHDGSSGDFSTVAPQVVLHGARLPWERDATGARLRVPWLAVLVCRGPESRVAADRREEHREGRREERASPWRMLEMARDTFTEVIAPLHALPSLIEQAPDTGPARIRVRAHRMPRSAGSYVAHLVSLQGCAPYFDSAHVAPRERTVRLASLHSWSFRHLPAGTDEAP
ncbi:hypothetical protein OG389_25535 [Streptomyces sp. NBC_00435]|uniref:hypothetical protein n=1 Tax=Streptomyces sp. NBC_00435 TaxID=2903649 RepID=UPI002E1E0E5F